MEGEDSLLCLSHILPCVSLVFSPLSLMPSFSLSERKEILLPATIPSCNMYTQETGKEGGEREVGWRRWEAGVWCG